MFRIVFRFLWHCLVLAWRHATQAAFGYAGPAGGAIAGVVGTIWFPRMMSGNTWNDVLFRGLLGGAAGWISVFLLYLLFVAPFKAWNAARPLAIKIKNQESVHEITQQVMQRHSVFVTVQNKSPLKSLRCKVSVIEASNMSHRVPWAIYTANIPPNDEHKIELAVWFFWKGNRENSPILIFAERAGAFAEANQLSLQQEGAEILIAVQSPDTPEATGRCRVFIDKKNERLVLEKMNAH